MVKKPLAFIVLAMLALSALNGCSGSGAKSSSTETSTTTAATRSTTRATERTVFDARLTAPSHTPKVNVPWRIVVTVKDAAGKPIRAKLLMNVLFGGRVVGQVDEGKVYDFFGRHQQDITWPPASIGYALTLQAVVTVKGSAKKIEWAVKVRR